jgi:hypothetical protein
MLTDPDLIAAFERLCEAIGRLDSTVNFGDHKSNEVTESLTEARYYLAKARDKAVALNSAIDALTSIHQERADD